MDGVKGPPGILGSIGANGQRGLLGQMGAMGDPVSTNQSQDLFLTSSLMPQTDTLCTKSLFKVFTIFMKFQRFKSCTFFRYDNYALQPVHESGSFHLSRTDKQVAFSIVNAWHASSSKCFFFTS